MNWTLEPVVVPVADNERVEAFPSDRLGFAVDDDITPPSRGNRLVQLTPPGSGRSVVIGEGVVPHLPPGSLQGRQLVVSDMAKAHAQFVERGVEVSEIQVISGDGWAVQQISARA